MYERFVLKFQIQGSPKSCERYGQGHINETYLVSCDGETDYILQKINKKIFTKPEQLMENIAATTTYISRHSKDPRASVHLVLTNEGKAYHKDAEGEYWRMYEFVPSTVCLQKAESPKDFYYSGLAFGHFQGELANFPAETLHEPIADFHNTPVCFHQLHVAMENNYQNGLLCAKRNWNLPWQERVRPVLLWRRWPSASCLCGLPITIPS